MLQKEFSRVDNFTGYLTQFFDRVQAVNAPQTILDIPAGIGLFAAGLREQGHQVTCADINRERNDYGYADMNQRLPFDDAHFDTCLCLEGIEHLVNSVSFIQELCRVTKPTIL